MMPSPSTEGGEGCGRERGRPQGQGDVKLSREEFERRCASASTTGVDAVHAEIDRVVESRGRSTTSTGRTADAKAGPALPIPEFELPAVAETRDRIHQAERDQKTRDAVTNPAGCGERAQRSDLPGRDVEDVRLAQLAREEIERAMSSRLLDLSVLTAEYGRQILPCKGVRLTGCRSALPCRVIRTTRWARTPTG